MIEALEGRRLCAGVQHARPVFSLSDGTLRVSGSVGDDRIAVRGWSGNLQVWLNGHATTVRKTVHRAVIYGGGGNDHIDCAAANEYPYPPFPHFGEVATYADGGTGHDTLLSSDGGDTLLGGSGDDRLQTDQYGLGRYDSNGGVYMDGGPGDDRLFYGAIIHGGSGRDRARIDSAYGEPVFTSGLERLYDDGFNGGIGETGREVAPKTDLLTRDGRLVLTYQPDGQYERNISPPYLRDDGRIGMTISYDTPRDGTRPPNATLWTVPFNDRYSDRARLKGIVLAYTGSAVDDPPEAWRVVLPASA